MPAPGRHPDEFKDRAIRSAPGLLGRPGPAQGCSTHRHGALQPFVTGMSVRR
mgnify:CR=1 FL=1